MQIQFTASNWIYFIVNDEHDNKNVILIGIIKLEFVWNENTQFPRSIVILLLSAHMQSIFAYSLVSTSVVRVSRKTSLRALA